VLAIDLQGGVDVVARVESFPMCIDHLADGRLLVVASSRREILRQEADGSLVTHAGLGGLADHPWNDIVADGRGNAYVNNIGFDFASGDVKPGIIALVTPDGAAREVADALEFPNGMAVTADNRTLIVAESFAGQLTAFDIAADGSLSNRRLWADLGMGGDGICLDAEGAIWVSDARGFALLRVREGGKIDGTVSTGARYAFACMLGGADRQTLFACTSTGSGPAMADKRDGAIETVRVDVPGAGLP